MTRTPHDQFSKQYLEELLSPLGQVAIGKEVPGEARQIDVFFSPSAPTAASPELLGLLGRLATSACLLEPFRNPPTASEVRDCLLKLFLVHAEVQRQARRSDQRVPEDDLPRLWILASSTSAALIAGFAAQTDAAWGEGVYLLARSLRTAIISLNQLPVTPATLWLRLLGKGQVQQQAIAELAALPTDNALRSRALDLLFSWSISIERSEELDEEERALIMQLSPLYTQRLAETLEQGRQAGYQMGIQAGRAEGRAEGSQAERRLTVEMLLQARFGADAPLAEVVEPILQLSAQDYARLLLELPVLSRQELLDRLAT